jgi:hypothetical protein
VRRNDQGSDLNRWAVSIATTPRLPAIHLNEFLIAFRLRIGLAPPWVVSAIFEGERQFMEIRPDALSDRYPFRFA